MLPNTRHPPEVSQQRLLPTSSVGGFGGLHASSCAILHQHIETRVIYCTYTMEGTETITRLVSSNPDAPSMTASWTAASTQLAGKPPVGNRTANRFLGPHDPFVLGVWGGPHMAVASRQVSFSWCFFSPGPRAWSWTSHRESGILALSLCALSSH